VESDEPVWRGYLYVLAITLTIFINIILNSQSLYRATIIGEENLDIA
jgi:hypothetical protein